MLLFLVPICSPFSKVLSRNLTSFTITWDFENCTFRSESPLYYHLHYNDEFYYSTSIEIHETSYTAELLRPHTTYYVQITVRNWKGTGPYILTNVSTTSPQGESESNNTIQ